jgi:hypothetical protein
MRTSSLIDLFTPLSLSHKAIALRVGRIVVTLAKTTGIQAADGLSFFFSEPLGAWILLHFFLSHRIKK